MGPKKELLDAQRALLDEIFGVTYHRDVRLIPDGESGRFAVSEDVGHDGDYRYFYQRIVCDRETVADCDPARLREHDRFLKRAKGRVLLSGLGCGLVLDALLKRDSVEHVTVIEKEKDIVALVKPAFKGERVAFVVEDVFQYRPDEEEHYDCAYHDIWMKRAGATGEEREKLEAVFASHCDWMGYSVVKRERTIPKNFHGKPGRSGRPKMEESAQRSVRKGIRFTPAEYKLLQKACEASDETESNIIQRGTVTEAVRIIERSAVREKILQDKDLKDLLTRISSD